jgi:hypothetical protein
MTIHETKRFESTATWDSDRGVVSFVVFLCFMFITQQEIRDQQTVFTAVFSSSEHSRRPSTRAVRSVRKNRTVRLQLFLFYCGNT